MIDWGALLAWVDRSGPAIWASACTGCVCLAAGWLIGFHDRKRIEERGKQ